MVKQHFVFVVIFAVCLMFVSCKNDSEPVSSQTNTSAEDVMKIGTEWIYENTIYDSTGAVRSSNFDTLRIIRDTVVSSEKWFVTSNYYTGGIYIVNGISIRDNGIWKLMRARSSSYDTVAISPSFKKNLAENEHFESVCCLLSNGKQVVYQRTLLNSNVKVDATEKTYDCSLFKETKITPDVYFNFEYQNYYYNSQYGLIKHEWYSKSKGGLVFRESAKLLHQVKILQ